MPLWASLMMLYAWMLGRPFTEERCLMLDLQNSVCLHMLAPLLDSLMMLYAWSCLILLLDAWSTELGLSPYAGALAGLMVVFDTAILAQSRWQCWSVLVDKVKSFWSILKLGSQVHPNGVNDDLPWSRLSPLRSQVQKDLTQTFHPGMVHMA